MHVSSEGGADVGGCCICMYLARGADVAGCFIWVYISSEGGRMLGVVVYGCMYLAKGGRCWGLLYMNPCA